MTPTQSKMARAALGWSLHDLAEAADVSRLTAARFETGKSINADSLARIAAAYEKAGAQMLDRSGRIGVTVPKP